MSAQEDIVTDRKALAARIQNVAERELAAVERVLDMVGQPDRGEAECCRSGPSDQSETSRAGPSSEAESCARTLAFIGRTLREISALNEQRELTPDETNNDPVPVDLDALRNELARRIHALIDAGVDTESAGGPETPAIASDF